MGWQVGRVMSAVLLGQIALLAMAGGTAEAAPTPDPAADGSTLYCLKSENARPLVDAAVKLEAARKAADGDHLVLTSGTPGEGLTVAQWQRSDPAGFRRACAALTAERKLPSPRSASPRWWTTGFTTFLGLVSAAFGAMLTVGVNRLGAGHAAAERAAADLHMAATSYARACRACLHAWRNRQGREKEPAMDEPLGVLTAELRRTANRHRKWWLPKSLGEDVAKLDTDIRRMRWPEQADQRGTAVDELLARLEKAQDEALKIAAALERPRRLGKTMRRPA